MYGLLIGALPIVLLNTLTLSVNAYNLWRMLQQRDYFTLMEIRPDSACLKLFLEFYRLEISDIFSTSVCASCHADQIIAIRDSLTLGDGDETMRGFPGRIIERVSQARRGSSLLYYGQSGWTSDALIAGD